MKNIKKLIFFVFLLAPNIAFASCNPWDNYLKGLAGSILSLCILIGIIILIVGSIIYIKNRIKKKPLKGKRPINIGLIIIVAGFALYPISYKIIDEVVQWRNLGCYSTVDSDDIFGDCDCSNVRCGPSERGACAISDTYDLECVCVSNNLGNDKGAEANAGKSCTSNSDCRCQVFDGAQFHNEIVTGICSFSEKICLCAYE
jgi:hypothetical protein